MLRLVATSAALAVLIAVATPARAQESGLVPDEVVKATASKKKKKAKKKKDGWHPKLAAGFNFAFSQSQGVVGLPDGISMALGLVLNGGLEYRYRAHAWITTLNVLHAQSKTPSIDRFVKSGDTLDLASWYQYRFPKVKMLGVFAGVKLTTALLQGSLIVAEDTAIDRTPDDPTDFYDLARGQKPYKLTNGFAPLLLKQFVGGLLKPFTRKWMEVDIKLGIGAVEVWTQNGYVLNDNADTEGILELKQLQDYQQAGVELHVNVTGTAFDKLLTYGVYAEIMYPFVTSIDTALKGAELFNTEFRVMVGIKLWKWVSLNYALAVLRVPLIQEDWQITNTLLLTVKANIVK